MSRVSRTNLSRTNSSRRTVARTAVSRTAALACAALTAAALSSFAATPAHADPGICIDHVMAEGYRATDAVLKACKIAKTGRQKDVQECRRILRNEGVRVEVANRACRIASYPEQKS